MTRSAADTGLVGESYCHEASGAPATPGEPAVQEDRPRGSDQVWGGWEGQGFSLLQSTCSSGHHRPEP